MDDEDDEESLTGPARMVESSRSLLLLVALEELPFRQFDTTLDHMLMLVDGCCFLEEKLLLGTTSVVDVDVMVERIT